jgi:hypothetical protein
MLVVMFLALNTPSSESTYLRQDEDLGFSRPLEENPNALCRSRRVQGTKEWSLLGPIAKLQNHTLVELGCLIDALALGWGCRYGRLD